MKDEKEPCPACGKMLKPLTPRVKARDAKLRKEWGFDPQYGPMGTRRHACKESEGSRYTTIGTSAGNPAPRPPDEPGEWRLVSTAAAADGILFWTWEEVPKGPKDRRSFLG